MGNRQRIGIGCVIGADHVEIFGDQKHRSLAARGEEQFCIAALRHRFAIGALDALFGKTAEIALGQAEGIIGRQFDFKAPRQTCHPAMGGQIIGGRADDVGQVGPDVFAAIAVKINRIGFEARRHELRLAHCTRP